MLWSKLESELRKLAQAELRQIREWRNGIIEDEMDFTPEFERSSNELSATWPMESARGCVTLTLRERSDSDLLRKLSRRFLQPSTGSARAYRLRRADVDEKLDRIGLKAAAESPALAAIKSSRGHRGRQITEAST